LRAKLAGQEKPENDFSRGSGMSLIIRARFEKKKDPLPTHEVFFVDLDKKRCQVLAK
jgi:hypothetical protein